MKKLLTLSIFLSCLLYSIQSFSGGVYTQEQMGNSGIFVRIVNESPFNIGCYIDDGTYYHRFIVYAQSYGLWYPVSGPYSWQCQ